MRVIKDRRLLEDEWQLIRAPEADMALPTGAVIVPFAYWQAEREALLQQDGPKAVWIDGSVETEALLDDLDKFALIALDFPVFKDGRSYTHARLLRERYGYRGELRAIGDVLRDQIFFMRRCGIDSYAMKKSADINAVLSAFEDFSVNYQTAADSAPPLYKLR